MENITITEERGDTGKHNCICAHSMKVANNRGVTRIIVDYIFPIDCDSLDKNKYGVAVSLWYPLPNHDNIPLGQNHYHFKIVEFNNEPDGYMLFNKKKTKTIAKKYALKALSII